MNGHSCYDPEAERKARISNDRVREIETDIINIMYDKRYADANVSEKSKARQLLSQLAEVVSSLKKGANGRYNEAIDDVLNLFKPEETK